MHLTGTELLQMNEASIRVFLASWRLLAPLLGAILLFRCAKQLLRFGQEPQVWAWLNPERGAGIPVPRWENVIGRSRGSDIVIPMHTVSRNHAVLRRYDDGSWTIADAGSKNGVFVNGERISICAITSRDTISIGGMDLTFQPITKAQAKKLLHGSGKRGTVWESISDLLILTVFQSLSCVALLLGSSAETGSLILTGFAGIILAQWMLLAIYVLTGKPTFSLEILAFFLCTMGMAAILTVKPQEAPKQLLALYLGLWMYLAVGWSVRSLERAKRIRILAGIAGIAFLVITLVFGREYYGAKNWLVIGSLSMQLSELVKICFIWVGAATLDQMMRKRDLLLFVLYALLVCGLLVTMNDFGTALIFFCSFLIIIFLRSGSLGALLLACVTLAVAVLTAAEFAPHVLDRLDSWRNIWENSQGAGYQQTKALMCLASGGLFGLGIGQGWMKHVFAADSDLVFATLGEEWGFLLGLIVVGSVMVMGIFAIRASAVCRSAFYVISSCASVGILLVQVICNVLGTLDVLPLTGVTFPFVSNGGSGMVGAWGLLAFVKALDTSQNATSAANKLKKRGKS